MKLNFSKIGSTLAISAIGTLMFAPLFGSIEESFKQKTLSANAHEVSTPPDRGNLQLSYLPSDNSDHEGIRMILEETEFFDELTQDLNGYLVFPQDIQVSFQECGEENAFYDPEEVSIIMCYELMQKYKEIFADEVEDEQEYEDQVINTALFTFLHELGHALVDQYNLPITGKEEDAVDEFATIILLNVYEDIRAAISGAQQFEIDAEEESELSELAFWGEHSLSGQRFYSTTCLIYGSNPNEYSWLVDEDYLPEERAVRCEEEYQQKSNSWSILLEPYLK